MENLKYELTNWLETSFDKTIFFEVNNQEIEELKSEAKLTVGFPKATPNNELDYDIDLKIKSFEATVDIVIEKYYLDRQEEYETIEEFIYQMKVNGWAYYELYDDLDNVQLEVHCISDVSEFYRF